MKDRAIDVCSADGPTPAHPKYPHVHVKLTGRNGNAFAILAAVRAGMRRALIDESACRAFFVEATAGDYDHLLATAMRWVEVS